MTRVVTDQSWGHQHEFMFSLIQIKEITYKIFIYMYIYMTYYAQMYFHRYVEYIYVL